MDGLYDQLRIGMHSVWRRRWLALAVMWGLSLVGWTVIALIPNSYESKAKLLVHLQPVLPSSTGTIGPPTQNDFNRIKEMLTSNGNLEKVVRRTDLNLQVASDRDLAAQVAKLRENIKVTAQQDDLIEVSATSAVGGFSNAQNARTATAVVQNLIDLFVAGNMADDRQSAGQTLSFLDAELNRRAAQLQDAEQRRVEFETKFMGLLPGEGSIGQRMSAAQTELGNIDQQLIAAQGSLAAARGQVAGTPETVIGPDGGGGGSATGQIAALQGQLGQLRARGFTDQHPDVAAALAQIERLRPLAEAERRSGTASLGTPNPLYVSLRSMLAEKEAQVAAAQARKNQLQNELAELSSRQTAEPEVMAQESRLNRDYDVMKQQYDKLLGDREQIRLKSDVDNQTDAVKFQVIQPPTQPTVPAAPNRPLLLTLILIVAIGAGIGVAFAKGQLQTTFPTQGRLEQVTGLPVLGSVSEVFTPERRRRDKQRLVWFTGAGGALAGSYALLMLIEFWQRSTVA
jgi:polysaccharide chain length determinant protein (PEP-CTERM system associated)